MRTSLILFSFALATAAQAQDPSPYLTSQRQPVRVSTGVVYQTYTREDRGLSELSIPLTLSASLGSGVGLTLTAHQATVSGDSLEGLSGLADLQIGLSYAVRLPAGSLLLTAGTNLPSGKRELTLPEFQTVVLLSQHYYSFRVPGFGQGFNVSPGIVWAFPLGDDVVAGIGAAYQYRGAYRPFGFSDDDYDPGDEITLTGGLDVRAGPTTNVSADVSYTRYAADQLGEAEGLQAGDKLTATAQVRSLFARGELRAVARYRSVSRSSRPAALGGTEDLQILPAQALLRAVYRHALSDVFTLGGIVQARIYDENVVFASTTLFDVGLLPEVDVAPSVTLYARALYTLGDFTGFEAGGGLRLEL